MNIKQIKTNAGNIVLCDVQWSNAESRGYGACKHALGDYYESGNI